MTRSQRHVKAARSAPSIGRLVALVAVLVGLFGMHGLSGHGSDTAEMGMGGGSMVAVVSTAVTAVTGRDAAMGTDLASQAHAPTSDAALALTDVVSGALSGGATSMLCLAVLAAGALLLLLALGRTRIALTWLHSPALFGVLRSEGDRDPPSLTAVLIRRC